MTIHTEQMPGLTVGKFADLRERFDFQPPYQRESGAWTTAAKQLFIDSIINGYLIPRVYIEEHDADQPDDLHLDKPWAILDGKQRLETILSFYDNELRLSKDFIYLEDLERRRSKDTESADVADVEEFEYTLRELTFQRPDIASKFESFEIPIVLVRATSNDEIEEMFERLNSSSSLNAAERRNAIGCHLRDRSNDLSEHDFFKDQCPIKNSRYKYRELASKFIVIELQMASSNGLSNLKAKTLMTAFQSSKAELPGFTKNDIDNAYSKAKQTLSLMQSTFHQNDPLLKSIGSLIVYYLVFRNQLQPPLRDRLLEFESERYEQAYNDRVGNTNDSSSKATHFRSYNAWVQSSNDGSALLGRSKILSAYLSFNDQEWTNHIENADYVGSSEDGEQDPVENAD